jgi:hypothetical protein
MPHRAAAGAKTSAASSVGELGPRAALLCGRLRFIDIPKTSSRFARILPGRRHFGATRPGSGAPESVPDLGGASPSQASALRPVTEGQGVAVRRGPKQLEVNHRSVGNERDSAGRGGELAGVRRSPDPR